MHPVSSSNPKIMIATLLLLFLLQVVSTLDNNNGVSNITWESQLSMAKSNTNTLLRRFLPQMYRVVSEANISNECERSLMTYSMALAKWKPWAIKMADASAKIPSGILEGTAMEFGAYEECLGIRVEESFRNSAPKKELFRGKYCTLTFKHSLMSSTHKEEPPEILKNLMTEIGGYLDDLYFVFGYCIPSACSKVDIQRLSSFISEPLGIKSSVMDCSIDETFIWPYSAIAAVCILCIIASVCIAGTAIDYLHRIEWKGLKIQKEEDKNIFRKLLEDFSILSNSEKFLKSSKDNDIGCFHGIRVLAASWIIYGHNYFFPDNLMFITYRRGIGIFEKFGVFSEGLLENFFLSVTTFFVLSGFLLMKTTWKQLEKNGGKLNFLEFLIHKYWRLTPALAFTLILLYALQVTDSGPLWNPVMDFYINNCDGYWWATMFFFNNFLSVDDMCLEHTWFVSALMQLHIVGFILLLVTYRWKSCGMLVGSLLSVACFALTCYVVILWDIPSTIFSLINDADKLQIYMAYVYRKPYFNFTPYLIGMIVAYLSEKYSGRKITKKYQILGWILAAMFAMFSIYGVYGTTKSKALSLLYHMLHRTTWALSIGLLIYLCVSGCGGIVNKMLSSRPMQLLGKLSYLMYLTHYLVFIYKLGSAKERSYFGNSYQVFNYISVFVVAMIISFIGYVTVEVPFSKLERLVFRRQTPK